MTKARAVNEIKLTFAQARELFNYDPVTGVMTRKFTRGNTAAGGVVGSLNGGGYRVVQIEGTTYIMARLIWFYMTGVWPVEVDHVNRIRDDDRWCNLREATRAQNCANKKNEFKPNKHGFRGVTRNAPGYAAHINVDNEFIHLGTFRSAVQAAIAYDMAALEHHGPFAVFNFSGKKRDWLLV